MVRRRFVLVLYFRMVAHKTACHCLSKTSLSLPSEDKIKSPSPCHSSVIQIPRCSFTRLILLHHFHFGSFFFFAFQLKRLCANSDKNSAETISRLQVYYHSPGPEVIILFSCSTQLSMELFLRINIKMPTTVGILIFMSTKNSILGLSESKNAEFMVFFL